MADPEMPTTNETPAPPAPPEPTPQDPTAAAIREKGPADSLPPLTAVTGEAPAAAATETKPPRRPVPEVLAGRVRVLDRVLVGFVLVLAFFLGTFMISNTDVWMHLESGKRISNGDATLGVDPFSYTTANVTWVNHSWLFDTLVYGLYEAAGPVGLVVFRSLILSVLALVLLRIREPGQSLWLPAVCTTLALLAVSTRLLLQPMIVSYLFFGLTLYLIHRALHEGGAFTLRGRPVSPLWLLPPLFALWVNLDGWFILGPLTVGLFLLGAGVQRLTAGRTGAGAALAPGSAADVRTLGLVLVVGLAACLVNPYLHRAFTLPLDLAYPLADLLPEGLVASGVSAREVLAAMPQSYLDVSPFNDLYWSNTGFGLNVAGMAYFPLLMLGLVSFALLAVVQPRDEVAARRFPVGLLLAWLPLAVLSSFNYRVVGFFAIVGAPAIVLNFQELSRRRPAGELTWARWNWAIGGRLATALGCLVLLLLTWPGRLHANADNPRYSHRVHFDVYTDASLESAARHLDDLLATGKLRNGFNVSIDAADYCAWFSPGVRTFYDGRFLLPPEAARDYALLRKALRDEAAVTFGRRPRAAGKRALDEVERIFRKYQINYLVVSGLPGLPDQEAQNVANRLTLEPVRWPRLYADGRTAVFGWRDPQQRGDPFAGLEPDYNRLAFGKVPEAERAPPQAPLPPGGPPDLWQRYVAGRPPTPLAVSRARSDLNDYELFSLVGPWGPRWLRPAILAAQHCGPLAAPGAAVVGPAELPIAGALLLTRVPSFERAPSNERTLSYEQCFVLAMRANSPAPPALPVLAVRAARRAVAEAPADADCYATLASAYWATWRQQERYWDHPNAGAKAPAFDPRITLTRQIVRHVQCVAALIQTVNLQPDNFEVHLRLSQIFKEMGYVDVALEHATLAKEHFAAMGPRRGVDKEAEEKAKKFAEEFGKGLEGEVRDLSEEVERRRLEYEEHAYGQRSLLAKVETALFRPTRLQGKGRSVQVPRGLARLALKLMGEADPKAVSEKELPLVVDLQIRLLLLMGRTRELRETGFAGEGKQRMREILERLPPAFGPRRYDQYAILYAAALGNYREADELLATLELQPKVATEFAQRLLALLKRRQAALEAEVQSRILSLPLLPTLGVRPETVGKVVQVVAAVRFQSHHMELRKSAAPPVEGTAEIRALRGLLALEQGDNARAVERFRASWELAGPLPDLFPSQPLVARYLRLLTKYW
jgi:hypothetical protein